MSGAEITVSERVKQLVSRHGSLRAAARALSIDSGYLSCLESGSKTNPSAAVLRKLGIVKIVYYMLKEPKP